MPPMTEGAQIKISRSCFAKYGGERAQIEKPSIKVLFSKDIFDPLPLAAPNLRFEPAIFNINTQLPHKGEPGINGGERGIRTPVTVARKSDFESDAFDHSAISPG